LGLQRFPNPWLCDDVAIFTQSLMRFHGLLQSFNLGLPDYSGTASMFLQSCGFQPWRSLILLSGSCFSLSRRFRDLLPPIVSLLGFHLPLASDKFQILQRFHPIKDLASLPSDPDCSGRPSPGYANPSSGFLTYSPVLSLSGESSHSHFRNHDRFLKPLEANLKTVL